MARRGKSNEAAVAQGIAGLVVIFIALSILFSKFRAFIILALCVAFVGFTIWISYRLTVQKSKRSQMLETSARPVESKNFKISPEPLPNIPTLSEQLHKIDWFQFEKLVELIYRHRGYSVKRLGGANPDGGVDLIIESPAEKFVVQCKQWKKWYVGVRQIREFLGTLADAKIQNGIFITLKGYSNDAKALAAKHGIKTLNEADVVKLLEESGLRYSPEISELLSDCRKFCPKCEKTLVLRTARLTGGQFWGCSSYPRCRFTMKFEM
jgi:hypothetical protein